MTSFIECLCTCVFLHLLIYMAESGLSCGTWDLLLQLMDSLVAALRLSCSMTCGILVPQQGIKPVSPALQGRLLTSGPLGKSPEYLLNATIDKAKCFYPRSASKVLFYPLICLYFFLSFFYLFLLV